MLTQELLKEHLTYDSETGLFVWNKWNGGRSVKGSLAGDIHPGGFRRIAVCGKRYKAHRLAWLYMTGEFPKHEIDHINGDPSDNSWSNLREVSHSENMRNMKRHKTNTSGQTGVYLIKKYLPIEKWRAQIVFNNRNIQLGTYTDYESAVAARKKAEIEFGFHKNHGRRA